MDRPVKLEPALKAWLDHVLIPALVERYIGETGRADHAITATAEGIASIGVQLSRAENVYESSMRSVRPLLK
jgi:hypothetical protein